LSGLWSKGGALKPAEPIVEASHPRSTRPAVPQVFPADPRAGVRRAADLGRRRPVLRLPGEQGSARQPAAREGGGAAARIEQFVSQIEQQLAFAALPQLGAEGLEQRRIEFLKLLRGGYRR
jgi:hypothetical protein